MRGVFAFIACAGFASPCFAAQIGQPVQIPVTVTVSGVVSCTAAGYCGDVEMIVVEE